VALALPLQRTISGPIDSLTQAVRGIAEKKDYNIRLPTLGRGEIGLLTTAFNQLLTSIEERDKALRAANESLRHSETQLKTIVENLSEGLVVSDLDGQLLHFNRTALALHGFSSNEDGHRRLTSLGDIFELSGLDGKIWPINEWPLARILRGERVANLEVNFRRLRDNARMIFNYGGTLVKDVDGRPVMAVVSMSDITERKKADVKVREQLVRLALLSQITRSTGERMDLPSIFQVVVRTLEEQLPLDFCCICLLEQGTQNLTVVGVGLNKTGVAEDLVKKNEKIVARENGLARCIKGVLVYEPDVTGSSFPFPQRLEQAGLRAFVGAPLLAESTVFGVLIAARREANSFSSGECEFLRQLSEHVALSAHQAQLHSALQQAYDDLRMTQQTVMQQERLRALGQMASGIAHDINNAISPVGLYTESLLETEPNLSPRARDYLTTIQNSIEDVAQTVARMREFYRQRETQLTLLPVQLNPLIQQVIELSRARWSDMANQKGTVVDVAADLDPNVPIIAGVESEIREALLNLIFNAIDAMPEGGKLTLRTKAVSKPAGGGNFSVIEVSDTGMGMDDDTRRRCLEPFFTTKGERGTGLGLAMVYGIAQRHGADIEIESEPGKGTTFCLTFPVPVKALQAAVKIPMSVPQTRMRILIIDDDPLLIKSLRDTLEMDGHAVVTATGGQAGIEIFQTAVAGRETFAVVITDLGMPYVDGRKVAAAIKAASPATPVILLTGWGQRMIADGDIPPNVDKVLNKPPKLRELREALAGLQPPS
jgi:signal transduction histidine kinase/PAS domain-containing protein/ActR/RegA family two-component response regulator